MKKHVAVLMGGWSAEREVSLISGAAVSNALGEAGYRVTSIDVQRDVGTLLTRLYPKPDAIFNALHGRFGEDGCIQGLLDILEIPYTHSGLLASSLAMDKAMSKELFEKASIPVAEHRIVSRDEVIVGEVMDRPYVVKPLNEGSSVGVNIIITGEDFSAFADAAWTYGAEVMVEKFIPGKEITVAVMGDQALAVTEIRTERTFYDYDAKYAEGGSLHVVPAKISDTASEEVMALAVTAHKALGCRGLSRADFRYDGNRFFILEVNTQPGMTPASLVPEQAAYVGIDFVELTSWMVENAEFDA